jgi:hypothetical protein
MTLNLVAPCTPGNIILPCPVGDNRENGRATIYHNEIERANSKQLVE